MGKQEFLDTLRERLSGIPEQELEDRLSFYGEMLDDRIEEGIEEEAAVAELGSIEEIATQIISDIPLSKLAKERIKPKKRLGALEITLIILGSPIWLSLAIALLSVILSLYVVLWSLIVSVWAVFVSLSACAFGGVASGVIFILTGSGISGLAVMGAALVCAGLSVFAFFGCRAATDGTVLLTKKMLTATKKCFVKRRAS